MLYIGQLVKHKGALALYAGFNFEHTPVHQLFILVDSEVSSKWVGHGEFTHIPAKKAVDGIRRGAFSKALGDNFCGWVELADLQRDSILYELAVRTLEGKTL